MLGPGASLGNGRERDILEAPLKRVPFEAAGEQKPPATQFAGYKPPRILALGRDENAAHIGVNEAPVFPGGFHRAGNAKQRRGLAHLLGREITGHPDPGAPQIGLFAVEKNTVYWKSAGFDFLCEKPRRIVFPLHVFGINLAIFTKPPSAVAIKEREFIGIGGCPPAGLEKWKERLQLIGDFAPRRAEAVESAGLQEQAQVSGPEAGLVGAAAQIGEIGKMHFPALGDDFAPGAFWKSGHCGKPGRITSRSTVQCHME